MATRYQFIFTNNTVGITTILFKNQNPILNVEKIAFYKETELTGSWLKKEYRYSFDDIVWSTWRTFTQAAVQGLDFANHPNFYIEVLYTRSNYNTAEIEDLYLFYDSTVPTPPDPSVGLIDADTLQGQPGSFYLDRANFTGPYTDLIVDNVPDGSTAGVYSHRIDTSIGSEFYFKRIEGGSGVTITDGSNGIITIDSSEGGGTSEYYNTNPVLETVGAIGAGETFFDPAKDFGATMQAMFYPTLNPTLTPPSNGLSHTPSGYQEIGDVITVALSATFSQGLISPQYSPTSSSYRSGTGSTVYFQGPDVSIAIGSNPSSPRNYNVTGYEVSIGNQTWNSYWDYKEGVQPYNSDGDPYDSSLAPGPTGSQTTTFEGVYSIYATISDIADPDEKLLPLVSMFGNNIEISLPSETGGNKQSFDIPDAWWGAPTNRPLQGIEQYNYDTTIWNALIFNTFTSSSVSHGAIGYKRYTYNAVGNIGDRLIRLKF